MLTTSITQVCEKSRLSLTIKSPRKNHYSSFLTIEKLFHLLPLEYNQLDKVQATVRALYVNRMFETEGGGGGNYHMKKLGMLVISLRHISKRCWCHLGCSR